MWQSRQAPATAGRSGRIPTVDGLTGLGNRAHFNKRWGEKVAECRRYPTPLSLALIDVDFFKRINDTYGHPAGDEVLQGISKLLQAECRQPDIPCRYGGEEFALVMPSTNPRDAHRVAERIREALLRVAWSRHPDHRVSVSIGLAGTDGELGDITPESWIETVDRNLYSAKNSGRNCTISTDLVTGQRLTTPPTQGPASTDPGISRAA